MEDSTYVHKIQVTNAPSYLNSQTMEKQTCQLPPQW